MNLKETCWADVDWMYPAQDTDEILHTNSCFQRDS